MGIELFALLVQIGETLQQNPLLAVATLFGAGVLTSLTPCVYPMIPITASIVAGTVADDDGAGATTRAATSPGAAASRRLLPSARTVLLTFTYVSGLALFYALLGVVAGMTGSLFGTVASNPWVRLGVGTLLLVFGLAMLEVIPVPVPQRFMDWAGRRSGGSVPAVFFLGAASGIVAAPCGAPAFFAVLTFVALTGSAVLGFVYLFVFSLGMTALLVAVGLFSGTLAVLPRAGGWMTWMKRGAGVILLAMAGYYFYQASMVF